MPKDITIPDHGQMIFCTPMITDSKSGSYVPVEGPNSLCCDEPINEQFHICQGCGEHAEPDTDAVNTVLSKMEAYVFTAMLASFTLGALTFKLVN